MCLKFFFSCDVLFVESSLKNTIVITFLRTCVVFFNDKEILCVYIS